MSTWTSEAFDRPSRRASRPFSSDEQAASEVIGFILTFGILSVVLVLSLWTFSVAKESTTEHVIETRATAVAQRVGVVAVEAAFFAEEHSDLDARFEGRLELPDDLEGRTYWVLLQGDNATVQVPSLGMEVHAPLFQADASVNVVVCDQPAVAGGVLVLVLEPADAPTVPLACQGPATDLVLYFQV